MNLEIKKTKRNVASKQLAICIYVSYSYDAWELFNNNNPIVYWIYPSLFLSFFYGWFVYVDYIQGAQCS